MGERREEDRAKGRRGRDEGGIMYAMGRFDVEKMGSYPV